MLNELYHSKTIHPRENISDVNRILNDSLKIAPLNLPIIESFHNGLSKYILIKTGKNSLSFLTF